MSKLLPADNVTHGIDHASTYKLSLFNWRNVVHVLRLKQILTLIKTSNQDQSETYIDIGCSNGYITNLVDNMSVFSTIVGFDYDDENILVARQRYRNIEFLKLDLNLPFEAMIKGDVVSCFETLEHVGDMDAAVQGILSLTKPGGRIILSVPIEVGSIGIFKYLAKVLVYRYSDLDELPRQPSKWQYFKALLAGDISSYRNDEPRREWGTHFGFDYRRLEMIVKKYDASFTSYSYFTTRIISITNRNLAVSHSLSQ